MSNYYLEYIEDADGDLVDITYWHRHCASSELRAKGDHPCPEWPDYTVACHGCNEIIHWAGVPVLSITADDGITDTVCALHLGYANDYRTEHWERTGDPADCLICEDDRVITRAERMT